MFSYLLYTVVMANELAIQQIFMVFNDGLSKSTMAAMGDGIASTGVLPLYVWDRLFDSFSDESLSDVDNRNNDDVGELYIGIQLYSATAKTLKSWWPSWIAGYLDDEM